MPQKNAKKNPRKYPKNPSILGEGWRVMFAMYSFCVVQWRGAGRVRDSTPQRFAPPGYRRTDEEVRKEDGGGGGGMGVFFHCWYSLALILWEPVSEFWGISIYRCNGLAGEGVLSVHILFFDFNRLFMNQMVRAFINLFIYSSIHTCIHSYIHMFIYY